MTLRAIRCGNPFCTRPEHGPCDASPPPKPWSSVPMERCFYCGVRTVKPTRHAGRGTANTRTRDHQLPKSRGGMNKRNLVKACYSCNQYKAALTVEEFRAALRETYGTWDGVFFGERSYHTGMCLPWAPAVP